MSGKSVFLLATMMFVTLTGFAKPVKVAFAYDSEGVSLIYNDVVSKECPKNLSIDFQLGGQLIIFKSGFESQVIRISKDSIFTSCTVQLRPLENKFDNSILQTELRKVSFVNYVTNYTQEEVTDIIGAKFKECNIYTQSQNSVFKNANVNSKRFAIGAEVVKSTSKNGAYTSPYYLFSYQKIKWLVLDNASNDVVLELMTDGFYLAYFKAQRGMVASDRLKEITVLSIEEAAQKFVNSAEFTALVTQGSRK
jgi:hypothetical protein